MSIFVIQHKISKEYLMVDGGYHVDAKHARKFYKLETAQKIIALRSRNPSLHGKLEAIKM